MTQERLLEGRKQVFTLFAQSREGAANATKDGDSLICAKTAGDFLLHLDHAQIPLCLIVVEGHGKIRHEGQNLPFVGGEPIEQIAGRILFGPASMDFFWVEAAAG
jgi:hypothetical protein